MAGPGFGNGLTCPGGDLAVAADDPALSRGICDMAARARRALGGCGLEQTAPLTIEVVEALSHPMGRCLATFDCDYGRIRVTHPSRYSDQSDGIGAYALLPPDVLLEVLIRHELTHALVFQNAAGREVPLVDQEYIAAAMELEHLDPVWRSVLLEAAPVDLPAKPALISAWIYGMAPRKFATNAWQHFSEPGNGCAFVRRIVRGEVSFARRPTR